MQLICTFVFAYAKSSISHDSVHLKKLCLLELCGAGKWFNNDTKICADCKPGTYKSTVSSRDDCKSCDIFHHSKKGATLPEHCYRKNCKVSKFWNTRNLRCNLPKIQTKSPNLRVFSHKDANGIANSEDPDQTAPLGAV